MSTSDSELLKIETFVLKVHMNCQGCMNKVRKVLQKIEGVYKVDINAEEQKVIVMGNINPSTMVQKLAKFGKHTEIWNAGYNDGKGEDNNQAQYITNEPSASENQYIIPTFGKDRWGPEWCFNQDVGFKTMESEINQHFATLSFLEKVKNRTNQIFTRINDNPKWEENMVPMMRPASFHENSGTNYSALGDQEWAPNFLGVSTIRKYGHQPSHMANIHGYYNACDPSNMMQLSSYNHLPWTINIPMESTPTDNDEIMNAYIHDQHMTNQMHLY
ncbi:uncharacterized protein LOC113851263 [Abrus precatorius]|uniref:Uncharacterized protein LOC113851263 n=1 Tax=Abrus precatorius TaxID=3816 RepID=A0A8B8K1K7_ABRPR|nr:uncharacterized protein LOC113851263 [Abrus precatorius]